MPYVMIQTERDWMEGHTETMASALILCPPSLSLPVRWETVGQPKHRQGTQRIRVSMHQVYPSSDSNWILSGLGHVRLFIYKSCVTEQDLFWFLDRSCPLVDWFLASSSDLVIQGLVVQIIHFLLLHFLSSPNLVCPRLGEFASGELKMLVYKFVHMFLLRKNQTLLILLLVSLIVSY